jgi:glycine cleavage system H protein
MSHVPDHLRYADSHEWIDPATPDAAPVGISDHAQAELTDVVYLELPALGRVVSKGEAIAVIESVKAANDIYSPASGEVVEVNEALAEDPAAVNTDPYGAGWMFRIKLSDAAEMESLMDAEAYRGHAG